MNVFAISDLHLAGTAAKTMDIFGPVWVNHKQKLEDNWKRIVGDDDLVLIPGDISWAMTIEEAMPDLDWLGELPGKKVITRGNHDFWWDTLSSVKENLPKSVYALHNNSLLFNGIAVTGTRLWDDPELQFHQHIAWVPREELGIPPEKEKIYNDEKIFLRELGRLQASLESISPKTKTIITMLHFPPTDFTFKNTRTTFMLQKYGVSACVFGHLHSLKTTGIPEFPVRKCGIDFFLVSGDFVDFTPVKVM
jgi:uncharacterized protein